MNPGVQKASQQIESFITNRLHQGEPRMSPAGMAGTGPTVIKIPVVVHVLYNNDEQRISERQVRSQIEILNRNFRNQHPSTATLPDHFKSLSADCFIEFMLATLDPQGKPTRGIIWQKTNAAFFGYDDKIKFANSGGDDAWDADHYLNIWIGKLSPGLMGYSSVPGGPKEKDGIVIRYTAFGTSGAATAPYHLGGTTVHETGHWLGLKHIWGDSYCGTDDISDTPPQQGPTKGCPTGMINKTCDNSAGGVMYMNYMDITYDECTNMFTSGQRERMRILFADGGPRHEMLFSKGGTGPSLQPGDLPVDSLAQMKAFVFPNPAVHTITVNGTNAIGEWIVVRNQLGETVSRSKITAETMRVNVSFLKNGVYFISIGAGEKVLRLVKIN